MPNPAEATTPSDRLVTLADIAARAGVAVSTVSRVINGSQLVAAKKRKAVEAIIDEMGYKPIPLERRKGVRKELRPWLKHHLFKTILFGPYDLFWITNYAPLFSYALHGIEEALASHQFQRPTERVESREKLLALLNEGGADGFLILNTGQEPLPVEVSDFPAVTFLGSHNHLSCDQLMTDPEQAGLLAARYLLSKGCKLCVAIGGDGQIYQRRIKSFSTTLAAAGVECVEVVDKQFVRGGPRIHQANRVALASHLREISQRAERPLGVFSIADILTPVIHDELARTGLTIGKEAHIVTCNNERPFLDALHPAPAVIDIHADYIGRRAVQQIMHRVECPRSPHERILIAPSLLLPADE
jgi:LacI family transcriptional regulator